MILNTHPISKSFLFSFIYNTFNGISLLPRFLPIVNKSAPYVAGKEKQFPPLLFKMK